MPRPANLTAPKPKKPSKKRPDAGTARARIFDAAVDLVCSGGPGAATARAICQQANITAPTLYHYFGDLYLLYNEVLELMYVPELEAHPGKEYSDPRGMIDYMWQCTVGTAFTKPGLVELKNQMVSTGKIPDCMRNFYARLERAFVQIARNEKLNFPPNVAAAMLWAAATGMATRIATAQHGIPYPKGSAEKLKSILVASLLEVQSPVAAPKKRKPRVKESA